MRFPDLEDVLLVLGAGCLSGGVGSLHWQSGVIVLGVLMIIGGAMLARSGRDE